ncbi:threonine aldolase family protein [Chelatococcus asaccharovorans]|uniref:threonine aldolase family protein n=1 Tax=Chelatococcus asaccharovorans TaxID=28210 RepID=UPI00224C7793|nr:low specificity L-threonine aldolase [Chelatococcus asaccharovorans]CAH1648574.1 Low specificity L-threonine aldolase [Chelatococcus asaccharovorans]CAH1687597.1 Low specificity L-threonine aldolase [Chelatococcus asaccharovorans]
MNFGSDNVAGASPRVLEALVEANRGTASGYGTDGLTGRVTARLSAIFERDVDVFLVTTGTAANALCLAAMVDPWGAVLCHAEAHVATDECGAPEFFSGGAKLVGLPGFCGKMTPMSVEAALTGGHAPPPHAVLPQALSLTQATEMGTAYTADEIAEIAGIAHAHGLGVHMDGARFANALLRLDATPATITWKAGVDIMSFGATKNGCLGVEAIVVFDRARARHLAERRKRSGHLLSKGRFLAAQLDAYLADDHWLDLARHANAMADRLAAGLVALGVRIAVPVEGNEVFAVLPRAMHDALQAKGAVYYRWAGTGVPPGDAPRGEERLVRLVTSFATTVDEVDLFLAAAGHVDHRE